MALRVSAMQVASVALAVAVAALAMAAWTAARREAEGWEDAGVGTNSFIRLQEFSGLHPELKDMYDENITRTIAPAAMAKLNEAWTGYSVKEREELRVQARAMAAMTVDRLRKRPLKDGQKIISMLS